MSRITSGGDHVLKSLDDARFILQPKRRLRGPASSNDVQSKINFLIERLVEMENLGHLTAEQAKILQRRCISGEITHALLSYKLCVCGFLEELGEFVCRLT